MTGRRGGASLFALVLAMAYASTGCHGGDEAGASDAGSLEAPDATSLDAKLDARPPGEREDAVDAASASTEAGIVLGYYADWAQGALPVDGIAWPYLTHVAHAFAGIDDAGAVVLPSGFVSDALVAAAHAHGVKAVLSVGGANVSLEAAASSSARRAATASALTALCAQHHYDGIDIDWEFPDGASSSDWAALLDELRATLDAFEPGLSLSATVSALPARMDVLPVAALVKLTWVSAMTYGYSGAASDTSGYLAPLMLSDAGSDHGSVEDSIRYLLARGVPAASVLLGVALHGEEFSGAIGDPVDGGPVILRRSDLVALLASPAWTRGWDPNAEVPYLVSAGPRAFVSFEDEASIRAKCAFARGLGLRGGFAWHLAQGVLEDGGDPILPLLTSCH